MLRWKHALAACALTLTIQGAHATTFNWTIAGEFDNGSGTLVASGSGGILAVTSMSGIVSTAGIEHIFGDYSITGPLPPGGTYASLPVPGDNLLFYPAAALVDGNGISFSVEQAPIPGVQQFMDIFFTGGQYFLLLSNSSANAITFSVSPEISSTPLPAALPLFVSGLGAFGLLGWRRRKKSAAITA